MLTSPSTKIIGHRGAAGLAPENTLAGIRKGLSLHVDYVEIDVRLTHDGIPVVIHDPSLKRTTGIKWKMVHKASFEQIRALDAGSWFSSEYKDEKIPTLEEVLLLLNGVGLMLEIKECYHSPDVLVTAIFKTLNSMKQIIPHLIIGSFSIPIMNEVRKHQLSCPHPIQTIGIVEKNRMISEFLEFGVDLMAPWYRIITPALMKTLAHTETWSFTVNELPLARSLVSMGVSGLITNFPDRILPLRE